MPRRTKARCGKQRDDCARIPAGYDWPHCADARRILCPAPRVRPLFEGKVASGLAEFSARLDAECNQIWLAVLEGKIVGSVAIDGEDLGNNEAHLRWFILDDSCRGSGVGRRLLAEAMAFATVARFQPFSCGPSAGFTPRARCMNHSALRYIKSGRAISGDDDDRTAVQPIPGGCSVGVATVLDRVHPAKLSPP